MNSLQVATGVKTLVSSVGYSRDEIEFQDILPIQIVQSSSIANTFAFRGIRK